MPFSIPHKRTKSDSARTQKTSQFRAPTQKRGELNFHTKAKSCPAEHKNQINFDHPHKIKSISIPHTKIRCIDPRTKNHVIPAEHLKNIKSI